MNFSPLYPLLLQPVYKDYIWGGNRIARCFRRSVVNEKIAESWEIADRPEGMSIVLNGALKGCTLGDLSRRYGSALVGCDREYDLFPLLIKIIDASKRLSLQVHPDEASALKTGGDPKTEAWLVLDAIPGALVYAGFKRATGEMEFRKALEAGCVESILNAVKVRRGDLIYIPGGRVHCIGEGCLLLEVQQNSNTTYRVYDWERLDSDGHSRELHVEQAMRTIRWDDTEPALIRAAADNMQMQTVGRDITGMLRTPYFNIESVRINDGCSCSMSGRSFHVLFVVSGQVMLQTSGAPVKAESGVSVLVPAGMGHYRLDGTGAELIRISLG